jgi:thioredoxin 1
MAHGLKYLTDNDFDKEIENGVTLVDFYADWCGPCRMISPIMEELASEYSGKAVIAKVDVDSAQSTASKYSVTSIPTVIMFVNGEEVKRVVGVRDKKTFKMILDAAF